MAEQEVKTVETEAPPTAVPAAPVPTETQKETLEEKTAPVVAAPPPTEEKPADESKALVVAEKPEPEPESAPKKISGGSHDRDVALADLEKEKTLAFIKAWEESEKAKVENKSVKKVSSVAAWEGTKKAALEAQLKAFEEKLEKQKAVYAETVRNKIALVHKQAEEKRATLEALRGEELLKAEETAAKYRATGKPPKKPLLGCF